MIKTFLRCDLCGATAPFDEVPGCSKELPWKWIRISRGVFISKHYCPKCTEKISVNSGLGLKWPVAAV